MVVNAKCNPCKEPTKYVAGFFDGPRGRRGCLFDCKNEQCEISSEEIYRVGGSQGKN